MPIVQKWLKIYESASSQLNDYVDRKVKELSGDTTGFNFVSLYLKEIEKENSNGGKFENR